MVKKLISILVAVSILLCTYSVYAENEMALTEEDAKVLSNLGFLKGTENGFELEREVTRAEAITMIVRITGHEMDAMLSSAASGFTDTDSHWYMPYVGYGVRSGIVNGTSETTFEPERTVTGQEFVKMLLLAMGYKDLTLENAYDKAISVNLLNNDDTKAVVKENITLNRSYVVQICHEALLSNTASGVSLYKTLINNNLFTEQEASSILLTKNYANKGADFISSLNDQMPNDKNYMFSPFSIKMALAMAANGADGETKSEILKATGIDDLDAYNKYAKDLIVKYNRTEAIKLNVANSIWINKDRSNGVLFNDVFASKITEFYSGESKTVNNNNAVDTINKWVSDKTNQKIPTIISDNNLIAALINAIYFKAAWLNEFKKEATRKDWFTDRNKKMTEIDFMNQIGYFDYYSDDTCKIVKIPYKNEDNVLDETGMPKDIKRNDDLLTSMYIVISDDKKLDFKSVIDNTKFTHTFINLSIPKFKIDFNINLIDMLKKMGITSAFDLEKADFKNMYSNGNMPLTQAIHKTYINVDEKETEAAAVTLFGAGSGMPPKPVIFKANSPFTFVIRDDISGEILFIGEYAFAE